MVQPTVSTQKESSRAYPGCCWRTEKTELVCSRTDHFDLHIDDRTRLFSKDILDEGSFFLQKELSFNEKAVRKKWKEDSAQHIAAFAALLNELSSFDLESIEQAFHSVMTDRELSFGQLGPSLRIALTGGLSGPSVFEICALLGKEACLDRLNSSIAALG